MADLKNVNQLLNQLKAEFTKVQKSKDKEALKNCGKLLDDLKVNLLKISYIPTDKLAKKEELVIARDVLEIGAEHSVASKNIQAFERYISQLKCYYYDYKMKPDSPNKYKLLGLNLLYLLSQNRVAEFHTELELLPADIIESDKFIKHPVALEQYLMEGRYNKLFKAKDNAPDECYMGFIDILLDTVRNEIGACLEQAYERISLQEASKRLSLKSKDEVETFGQKRKWNLGKDGYYHFSSETPKIKEPIPSVELAEMAIGYARELEMIV